jgi:2-succinyl-6-hydroxy-2,4-cyclohexadiene-1-carboxylate synthase
MKCEIEGITYHVEFCGEGYPLIMFHGFTGRGANWLPFCSTLGKGSTLIMPDIIGHGLTAAPQDDESLHRYSMESVAHDFLTMIDQLGYEKVDILGYSMGGRLALSMAVLFPDRVRKLILESASPGLKTEGERQERNLADKKLGQFMHEKGMETFVDYWENLSLFESQKSLAREKRSAIRKQRLMNSPIQLRKNLINMGTGNQPSYWGRLDEIQAEVLMIVGGLDLKFCRIAEDMQKTLKKGKIYQVKQCGHAIHVEQPEKFGTIVSEFLSNT